MPNNPSPAPIGSTLDTRERILRVAAEAWHASSFDGVGIAEICRLANVHKGSFFHFFASKDDVLLAVLERYALQVGDRLRQGPFRNDLPPLERFRRFFTGMGDAVRDEIARTGCMHGCPIGNVVLELATRNAAVQKAAARVFDEMRAVFAEAIAEAKATGALPATTDARIVATSVLAFMQGLAVLGKAYGSAAQFDRISEHVMALLGVPASRRERRPRRRSR